jgi:tRNA (guanosine-2'-O-)-methyltransferase
MTPARFRKLKSVLDRRQPDLTVVAENVHKPHNVAAIIRTCDAVGVLTAHLVSAGGAVPIPSGTARGSTKWVSVEAYTAVRSAYDALRARGHRIYVAHLSDRSVDFRDVDYTRPTAVVLGAELEGPSVDAVAGADGAIAIPMFGLVESLNVSVAAALILFEAQRQRQRAGLYAHPRLDPDVYRRTLFEWSHPKVARRCREQGVDYPSLDEHGDIVGA